MPTEFQRQRTTDDDQQLGHIPILLARAPE